MSNETSDPLSKHASAERTYGFDFSPQLKTGETLTGTPTITATPADELTIASVQVNSSHFDDPDGNTSIAASKGVTAKISGGESGTVYTLVVTATIATSGEVVALTNEFTVVG
jgi:hypothetical protein